MFDWIRKLIDENDTNAIITLLKISDVLYKGIFASYKYKDNVLTCKD